MHSLGFAHRDIKLDNIVLNRNLVPKLADFSHSKYVDKTSSGETVKSTTFCGSIRYFPPEILQLKPYDPIKYDMWSLGVTLYHAF
jgi:serine/threonine protein kinase